ncbi:hypothetical protein [Campylobacter sp. RM12651]|uniref:hypothetical protein n=1 Tax=Campylobacter sp. RM12651 TaxID=1660079 RepID=UPI001EFB4A31|nr:hypothetical protein [Campylobacter sp. RM12651]ULO04509.1 hypothetical protein AVBRAN_a0027 [Campylobacter sp. RM12651]
MKILYEELKYLEDFKNKTQDGASFEDFEDFFNQQKDRFSEAFEKSNFFGYNYNKSYFENVKDMSKRFQDTANEFLNDNMSFKGSYKDRLREGIKNLRSMEKHLKDNPYDEKTAELIKDGREQLKKLQHNGKAYKDLMKRCIPSMMDGLNKDIKKETDRAMKALKNPDLQKDITGEAQAIIILLAILMSSKSVIKGTAMAGFLTVRKLLQDNKHLSELESLASNFTKEPNLNNLNRLVDGIKNTSTGKELTQIASKSLDVTAKDSCLLLEQHGNLDKLIAVTNVGGHSLDTKFLSIENQTKLEDYNTGKISKGYMASDTLKNLKNENFNVSEAKNSILDLNNYSITAGILSLKGELSSDLVNSLKENNIQFAHFSENCYKLAESLRDEATKSPEIKEICDKSILYITSLQYEVGKAAEIDDNIILENSLFSKDIENNIFGEGTRGLFNEEMYKNLYEYVDKEKAPLMKEAFESMDKLVDSTTSQEVREHAKNFLTENKQEVSQTVAETSSKIVESDSIR